MLNEHALAQLGAAIRLHRIGQEIAELEAFLGGGSPKQAAQPHASAPQVPQPQQRSPAVLAMMRANKKRYAERRRQQRLAEAGQSSLMH